MSLWIKLVNPNKELANTESKTTPIIKNTTAKSLAATLKIERKSVPKKSITLSVAELTRALFSGF
ncbi:MAG: hypothetical protein IPP32_13105 [Bacteroidetes bacterium]|nr:hypothetical protein [Bacteroidota bacterium]